VLMSNIDKFNFSADRPIHNIEEDLLGRAKFSENLAEAISNWNGKDSLVVALYGDWGAGKSSVKNMALTYIKNKTSKPMVIEFSPWEWAAQEKITKAFFNEISKSIGKENSSEKNKKLADSFKKYGNYLAASEVILTSTSNSLPFVVSAIAGIGFFNAFINDTKIITLITTGIVAVSPFLKWGIENLKKLAGYYDEKAKDNEKTLTEIRSDLKVALQELENPILIVMDDLDRLNTSELRMIFQLIKANTEFPNVTFLLLFQRNIVEERLTDTTQSGKDYLEKIIQVPFNIPKISQVQVHEVLFDRLNKILELDKNSNLHFDQDRWTLLYHAGLKNYFNNLRNVYRYTSTLA
ncbi:P-loop NTPase fold protein, partial [Acinetobacter baumannii]|uniref:KAP family P-loop NTPase fold protein n=1 Tax=Acinetobacter baumannii TaxID=470 RepID=UPI0038B4EF28